MMFALALLACAPDATEAPPLSFARGWGSGVIGGLSAEAYVPKGAAGSDGRGALIVLHGCSQTPAQLKAGSDFDAVAEAWDLVVVLPEVANGGAYFGCWDYYGSNHSRTSGDPADLLDLVDAMTTNASAAVDPSRVYIAGLSSGGGMAMVMGCLAPDVFAGVGIAAGPTVGTSAFEAFSVGTSESAAVSDCTSLAGANAPSFSTQLTSVIAGTNDFTVAQGYAPLNADVMSAIYGTNRGDLVPSSFDVAALEGHQPKGTGTVWSDSVGPRVSLIEATGMGHAWPGGTGPGPEISFVATEGVDYAWYLAEFFALNDRRSGAAPPVPPTEPEPPVEPDPTEPVDTGTAGTTPPPGDDCEPWVDLVSSDINGHLSRYDVYPAGYGVADRTYVDLLSDFGLYTDFDLYEAPSGDWYLDPDRLPGCD